MNQFKSMTKALPAIALLTMFATACDQKPTGTDSSATPGAGVTSASGAGSSTVAAPDAGQAEGSPETSRVPGLPPESATETVSPTGIGVTPGTAANPLEAAGTGANANTPPVGDTSAPDAGITITGPTGAGTTDAGAGTSR